MAGPRREKRLAVLEAATHVFRDEGYENANMDHIATLANVSKRTVYNHFGSKEALFKAVLDHLMVQAEALKNIPYSADRSLEEQLQAFVNAKMSLVRQPAWSSLLRVMLGVLIRDPAMVQDTVLRTTQGENALTRWLEAADRDGRLRTPQPELAAQLFWSMVGGGLFWPALMHLAPDEAAQEVLTREIIATFLQRYGTKVSQPQD